MFTKLFRGVIHNIYKTIQGREIKHTQYQGREQGHTQYLQNCSGERTIAYTIFTKLCRGEN